MTGPTDSTMVAMRLYNTLGGAHGELVPRQEGRIGMYVCGPTVQSAPHLGHGRAEVVFDMIRRYLTWRGYNVTFVRNVTDVDDKIIAIANERDVSTDEVVSTTTKLFLDARARLGVAPADVEPRATEHIDEMIAIIDDLIAKGLAYEARGDVYFSVESLPEYGKLSGRSLDDMIAGARVEVGEHKRHPGDFALWKAAKPGEPQWDSPWGMGRPGWHIECSAMAIKYLGESFDIHGGGSDLIFPHHENEIAQSEGHTGRPFATWWLHNGMLTLTGEKMAKSTGHLIDLNEALTTYPPMAVRLFYLRAHYRSPLEFSTELLEDAVASYERLQSFVRRSGVGDAPDQAVVAAFTEAMDDDFNTPIALAVVFEAVRAGNRRLDEGGDSGDLAAAVVQAAGALGVDLIERSVDDLEADLRALAAEVGASDADSAEGLIASLLATRATARDERAWDVADAIREGFARLGITVEDAADGVRWHRA